MNRERIFFTHGLLRTTSRDDKRGAEKEASDSSILTLPSQAPHSRHAPSRQSRVICPFPAFSLSAFRNPSSTPQLRCRQGSSSVGPRSRLAYQAGSSPLAAKASSHSCHFRCSVQPSNVQPRSCALSRTSPRRLSPLAKTPSKRLILASCHFSRRPLPFNASLRNRCLSSTSASDSCGSSWKGVCGL